jgi:hypothetical protein
VAQDGTAGHSPYTAALALTMRRPGLDIFQTFNQVGLLVKRSTGGAQRPWVSSSPIDGNFYFAGPQASLSSEQASPVPRLPEQGLPAALRPEPNVPVVQAGGLFAPEDMQRVLAIAKKDQLIKMPEFRIERPDDKLPAALRKFVGIWASEVGGNARHMMLIIGSVDAEGRAEVHHVWGVPGPADLGRNPAGHWLTVGTIAQGQLAFQGGTVGVAFQARSGVNDSLILQRFKDGKRTSTTALKPVWRLVEAEQAAKR